MESIGLLILLVYITYYSWNNGKFRNPYIFNCYVLSCLFTTIIAIIGWECYRHIMVKIQDLEKRLSDMQIENEKLRMEYQTLVMKLSSYK
jgi:hypothetical protein